jgi:hypothetical protein
MRTLLAAALLVGSAAHAQAQIYETVGTRAQGMGGAFVAVADDASATWWNPAGLATGAYFNFILGKGQTTEPADHPVQGPAWQSRPFNLAAAFPALGLSYYRLRISEIRPSSPTAVGQPDRQDQGATGTDLHSLTTSAFGVTFGQSLGGGLVIGSTLKLVRGGSASSNGVGGEDLLERADDLEISTETHGDLDVGAMLSTSHVRVGVSVKHVSEPEFGEGALRFVLERQARAGLAVVAAPSGSVNAVALAVDIDLTTTSTAFGEAKHLAGGAEAWLFSRRLGVRGGVSRNRAKPSGTSTSAGLSLALRPGVYADGALTFGNDKSRDGWDVSLRMTF